LKNSFKDFWVLKSQLCTEFQYLFQVEKEQKFKRPQLEPLIHY